MLKVCDECGESFDTVIYKTNRGDPGVNIDDWSESRRYPKRNHSVKKRCSAECDAAVSKRRMKDAQRKRRERLRQSA